MLMGSGLKLKGIGLKLTVSGPKLTGSVMTLMEIGLTLTYVNAQFHPHRKHADSPLQKQSVMLPVLTTVSYLYTVWAECRDVEHWNS
jgi:hypothetical protein